jgi:hypothetical protein
MKYSDKLKDPRWQKKRLEIFERDGWQCGFCGTKSETLHVHHLIYQHGKEPWDCHEENLLTLCSDCHQAEFEERKNSEAELIEFLHLYRFTWDNIHELMCVFGRHMERGKDRADDILNIVDRSLWNLRN